MTPAGGQHGRIAIEISARMWSFVRENKLGTVYAAETGFRLASDPDTVRAPDVAFVATARAVETIKYFPGAPDMAVEVVSPNDSYSDVAAKVGDWLTYGTQAVWVVDPQRRTIEVHRAGGVEHLSEQDTLDGGEVLPGFRLAVRDCFTPIG